jgi:hypothetical protein
MTTVKDVMVHYRKQQETQKIIDSQKETIRLLTNLVETQTKEIRRLRKFLPKNISLLY